MYALKKSESFEECRVKDSIRSSSGSIEECKPQMKSVIPDKFVEI
jgi:hypothetical protein